MKLYCKVVAILLCLGTLLLLYLFVGNADEPPLKGAGETRWLPVSSGPGGRAHPLFAHFQAVRAAPKEEGAAAAQIAKREPRLSRNPGKRSPARGKFANARPGKQKHLKELPSRQWMHLAVVACGNRLEETLIMLKSAVLFSYRKLKFHIFAEDSLKPEFEKKLREWPASYTKKFEYNVYPIAFSVGNAQEWKKLFKPCAAQRLFLPVILKDVDSLLYVDTDVLFLRPIDDIWSFLKEFNSTQLAAMAPEHEIPKIGWYSRFARHPYYGTTGVNSGVMLMNLTRIRNTQFKNSMIPTGLMWEEMLYPLYQKYKNYITWGDQDLLNIIFYFNPECLYVFPCQWNYRPDHCMYGSNCKGAEEEGISVLHGNRGVYHDDKQPTFKALYEVIRDFPFEDNLFQSLYYPLQSKFLDTVHTLCGRIPQVFLKQIEKTMKKVYENRVIVHVGANYRY
ncbi:glucoside xylosyltransferase 2 isoform X2 [Malaclemys terrapin pileata]|uniref:glucoside xylosyltransferase 2 isoform X2 n=1 Tax=Malaclemys terrapin pileata TaxID=2991368 RepID=UPI0023A7A7EA|nr:glucoside xylosyltransferase 2 isoform X2 [Malaclemys terrapin pileata]